MKIDSRIKYFAVIFVVLFIVLSATNTINTNIILGSIAPYNFLSSFIGVSEPLSISTVNINDTDGKLLAKTMAVTFTANRTGGYYTGSFSPTIINNLIPDSQGNVSKGFNFNGGITSEKCYFPMIYKTQNIDYQNKLMKYVYKSFTCKNILGQGDVDCGNAVAVQNICNSFSNSIGGYYVKSYAESSLAWEHYASCIYKTVDGGGMTEFGTPYYSFGFRSELTIDGYTSGIDDLLIANIGTNALPSQQGFYKSGVQLGYISWAGNLSTGRMCPVVGISNKVGVNLSSNNLGTWLLVDSAIYSNYITASQAIEGMSGNPTAQTGINFVSTQNQSLSNLKLNAQNNTSNGKPIIESATGVVGSYTSSNARGGTAGALYYEPTTPLAFPVFTLFIKADSLAFVSPQPKVSNLQASAGTNNVLSGGQIPINVSWQNSGQSGAFNVVSSCSLPFTSLTNSFSQQVNAGQPGSAVVYAQGICSNDSTGNCSVTVSAVTLFGTPSSLTSSVNNLQCKKPVVCEGTSRLCENSATLKVCSNGQWIVTNCPSGQTCNNGYCITSSTCPFGQEKWNNACVPVCGANTHRDAGTGNCVSDVVPPTCAVGEHLVISDTPVWWSLGLIKETKTYCEKDTNYALIVLIIVAGISVVAVALIFKGKGKRKRR